MTLLLLTLLSPLAMLAVVLLLERVEMWISDDLVRSPSGEPVPQLVAHSDAIVLPLPRRSLEESLVNGTPLTRLPGRSSPFLGEASQGTQAGA